MLEKITDRISSLVWDVSPTFLSNRKEITMMMRASGTMRRKILFQPQTSTIHPESVGPMAGAKAITIPIAPIAAPRFSRGKRSNMTVCIIGISTPAAIACSILASRSTAKLPAKPATAVPAANISIELRNSCLVVKRSMK